MIEIIDIENKELFAAQITNFLFLKFSKVEIDIYGKTKGKEWENLKGYNTASFFRKFILRHQKLVLPKGEFEKNKKHISRYLIDWGFYIDENNHGLFSKHTNFIEISNENELKEMENLLIFMRENGIIKKYEYIYD